MSMNARSLGLEHPDYVVAAKSRWGSLPLSMIVIEYFGDGDQAFGGYADDRVLGVDDLILDRRERLAGKSEAVFLTVEEAHEAAKRIKNRRQNSLLGVAPSWR